MQVTETSSEGLKREFQVLIPADTINGEVDARLTQLAPTINMPGFRPGKVPVALLKKRYGPSVMGEVLEKTVNETSQKTLEERELRAATQPQIEITKFEEGGDLEFSMVVDIMPEITPIDFSTLEIERLTAEPGEADLDEAIGKLASQHKSSEPIKGKRKSKSGDIVVINFKGMVDGEAFDGGSAEGHQLELGSGTFIPGFEEQLVGVNAGDKVDVKVTFPEDYGQASLAGKEAIFETEVTEIRETSDPKIDDEFAKLFGMDDLDSLKEAIKGQLAQEYVGAARNKLKRTLLDTLEKKHSFEVPDGMVQAEYDAICQAVNPQQHDHDHDHDHDHAHQHAADEALSDEDKAEYRGIAERRVRLGLLLQEVGRLNNISIGDEEVARAIYQEATKYPGQEQQVVQFYQQNAQAQANIRAPLLEDKIVDFIVEMAKVTEKTVTAEELFKDDDEEAAEEKPAKKAAAKKPAAKKKAPAKKPAAKSKKTDDAAEG
ncbi:trigger factor [Nisaea sp.]|uniref:trigger factor n=1 Tax=Nisaea sp. TaxID=2024842 RepID=UPI0032EDD400